MTAVQGGIEGGFQGRTNKLVDGCYSLWQGGVFPLLAALLRAQPQQQQQEQEQQQPEGASAQPDADAVQQVLQALQGQSPGDADGGSLEAWLTTLPSLGPEAAAEARQTELQRQLDAAVESSLEAEERYRAVPPGTAAAAPLQQEAVAVLEAAAELQRVSTSCGRWWRWR